MILADSGHQTEVGTSTQGLFALSMMALSGPSNPRRQLLIFKSLLKWGNQDQKGVVTCPMSHS